MSEHSKALELKIMSEITLWSLADQGIGKYEGTLSGNCVREIRVFVENDEAELARVRECLNRCDAQLQAREKDCHEFSAEAECLRARLEAAERVIKNHGLETKLQEDLDRFGGRDD